MLNKKGFTLIELLAVILILTSVSLIAVASISSSLQRRDDKECDEQIEMAKNAAKIYFSINNCTGNDNCSVNISTLKKDEFFNEKSKTDKLKDSDSINFTNNGYTYNGTGECKES